MIHEILKDFSGSQDGRFTETFKAGTKAKLSAYLAAMVVPTGLARLPGTIENKAIVTDGSQTGVLTAKTKK